MTHALALNRALVRLLVATAALVLGSGCALAQTWPVKPVHIVVPYPPGGTNDALARLLAERLTERWRQQVIVDNRPGATGNIGADHVARSAPDGHELLVVALDIVINPSLYKRMSFDVRRDLAAVTALATTGLVITVSPASGITSLQQLIARAKAEPGKLAYASCGNGTPHHLAAEMLKARAGIDLVHVPYKGCGLAQTAMVAGEVPIGVNSVGNVAPMIKAGRLRPVAVTSARRDRLLAEVPTVAEAAVPGFEVTNWFGMFAAGGTPPETIAKLYADLKAVYADPAFLRALADRSLEPELDTPEHFQKVVNDGVALFAPIVKQLGLQLD
jgi:tripartite-type tricarboxylate transporter receptor subunit TctC